MTQHASSVRADADTLFRQNRLLARMPLLTTILNSISEGVLILNGERQIVFFNAVFEKLLGTKGPGDLIGLRPGEALQCIHCSESEAGCGTSEFCRTCGAVNATLSSQSGTPDAKECRIVQREEGNAMEFLVRASPLVVENESFTLFAITDIGHEKRRRALERIFFHDIMNTAASLKLISSLLKEAPLDQIDRFRDMIAAASGRLVEEIESQRDLMAAENHELSVKPVPIRSVLLLKELLDLHETHQAARGRLILIHASALDVRFTSDKVLLSRVLGNMIRNALEGSNPGETVTLGTSPCEGGVEFWVHNRAYIPRDVQLQIFHRSFSTKGADRGLGTYGIKLLTERYLQGRVTFTTDKEKGTTFRACFPLEIQTAP